MREIFKRFLSRIGASLYRWFDLIILLALCILISFLLTPFIIKLAEYQIKILSDWPSFIQFLIIVLIIGISWFFLIRLGGFRFGDLFSLNLFRYPATWIFGIIGAIGFILLSGCLDFGKKFPSANNLIRFEWSVLAILSGITLSVLLNRFFNVQNKDQKKTFKNNSTNTKTKLSSSLKDPQKLANWIHKETPITNPLDDCFGRAYIARRITEVLLKEKLKTVGVVGSFGSGKSSLLNMIDYYLSHREELEDPIFPDQSETFFRGKVLTCRIDGWGRSSGTVAQQILSIAVKCLSKEVDGLSVVNLPAKYQQIISSAKRPFADLLSFVMGANEDPIRALKKFDFILRASNLRLVLFLEDLDRNLGIRIIRNEVSSLLDRLQDFENLSFIFSVGTSLQHADILVRVCEHIENLV